MIDIGRPGETSEGTSINNAGRVVGSVGASGTNQRAFRLNYGPLDEVAGPGFFNPNISASKAFSINDHNQIVGTYYAPNGYSGFIYENNTMRSLGDLLGSAAYVTGINNHGIVAGASFLRAGNVGDIHAYTYDTATNETKDLGTLAGANESYAWDINDRGQVVGQSGHDAFMYDEQGIHLIPELQNQTDGVAEGINENGDLVGRSGRYGIVNIGGETFDLNQVANVPAGWTIPMAWDINDRGQIVGYAVQQSMSIQHAFLLNPISDETAGQQLISGTSLSDLAGTFSPTVFPAPLLEPVPEPVSGTILLGISALALRRGRHDN